jgi:hypothetical protein
MTSVEDARERIAEVAVTLRAFVRAAGAVVAVLVLDQGEQTAPLLVECPAEGAITLSEGERTVALDADRLAAVALPLPDVRALPPFEVDALRAEITAPLGGVEHHARAVRSLADAFPGRSVLTVTFATSDPDTPLQLAARSGDPMVLALGEEQFEMDPGWPPDAR